MRPTAGPGDQPDDVRADPHAGGFSWIIGDHEVAPAGTSECALGIGAATHAEVREIVQRAQEAGATVAADPSPQPWGYAAAFTDPDGHVWTVTSATLPG